MNTRVAATIAAWALAGLLLAPRARAQCGARQSTCASCHDGTQAVSPSSRPWHADHAFADLCQSCHQGQGEKSDAAEAHLGLVDPLARSQETCGPCHGDSTPTLLGRYHSGGELPKVVGAAGGAPPAVRAIPPARQRSSRPHGESGPNRKAAGLVLALGALLAFVWHAQHVRRRNEQSIGDEA